MSSEPAYNSQAHAQGKSARSPHLVPSITSSTRSERLDPEKGLSVRDATSTTPELNSAASLQSVRGTGSLRSGTESLSSLGSDLGEQEEQVQIFQLARVLQAEPVGFSEPWYLEMTTLRRVNFLDINNKLAKCRKKLFDTRVATEDDIKDIREILHIQADAIRDLEYIRSLDRLSRVEKDRRHQQSNEYFRNIAQSRSDCDPFESGEYRRLHSYKQKDPWNDEVLGTLLKFLPVSWTWTEGERNLKKDMYDRGYRPTAPSGFVQRLAKFIIAITGSLFILVPMYVMALHQSQKKNLITTTVAVVLFAITCSVMFNTSNDQTLAATFGYAAVLMVFVGLTTQGNS